MTLEFSHLYLLVLGCWAKDEIVDVVDRAGRCGSHDRHAGFRTEIDGATLVYGLILSFSAFFDKNFDKINIFSKEIFIFPFLYYRKQKDLN